MNYHKQNKKATMDFWQMEQEFSKLGSERLTKVLISAGEWSDPLRRVMFIWSAFINFDKDRDYEKLEKNLILALTIEDFKSDDEVGAYDLVIYELQNFLYEKLENIEYKKNIKHLFDRLKPVIEESSQQLSEDWIWSSVMKKITDKFNEV